MNFNTIYDNYYGIFTAGKVTVVGATTNRFIKVARNLHNYPAYP